MRLRHYLTARDYGTKSDEEQLLHETKAEIDAAAASYLASRATGFHDDLRLHLCAGCQPILLAQKQAAFASAPPAPGPAGERAMTEISLVQAINLALARAMDEDERVLVLGEDVGIDGGVFRATDGLYQALWRRPGARHAARGGRYCGHFRWPRRSRVQTDCGNPVYRIHLSGHRPDRQPRVTVSHAYAGTVDLPDDRACAVWRGYPCAGASLGKPGGHVHEHPGSSSDHPVITSPRLRPSAGSSAQRGSGRVHGADPALSRRARGDERRRRRSARSTAASCCGRAGT